MSSVNTFNTETTANSLSAMTPAHPSPPPPAGPAPIRLGQGFYWQDLQPGQVFDTFRRTITETDLVNFISCTGMLEAIFIEDGYPGSAMAGRPVPGALTYALIEGFILQSMIQGTGLAMLELQQQILAPVQVGDTIGATITVTTVTPTSRSGRAVVASDIAVHNQHGQCVMRYTAKRLLAGRPAAAASHQPSGARPHRQAADPPSLTSPHSTP